MFRPILTESFFEYAAGFVILLLLRAVVNLSRQNFFLLSRRDWLRGDRQFTVNFYIRFNNIQKSAFFFSGIWPHKQAKF